MIRYWRAQIFEGLEVSHTIFLHAQMATFLKETNQARSER